MLALHILGSGSKGNSAVVEDVESGHGLLVDCGICRRDTFGRAKEAGFDMERLDAILVTHDHSDHTSKLGVIVRGLKRDRLPLYVSPEVQEASSHIREVSSSVDILHMHPGIPFEVGTVRVFPFETSHDAASSCGFRFESPDGDSIGYVTDTGFVTEHAMQGLTGVRILAIESNHDGRMLVDGPYPFYLKERIRSDLGHLSNEQAAEAIASLAHDGLEHIVGMHLSENNNLPSLAREALEDAVQRTGLDIKVSIASQRMLVSIR